MIDYLGAQRLLGYVLGQHQRPVTANVVQPTQAELVAMADWDKIDLQVKSMISMRLSTNLRTLLGTTSAATWTNLEQCYSVPLSGFHQVALQLDPNGLRPQGLKEHSDSYLASDYLRPILGSKCLVMQTTGNYLGLGPSEETSGRMFQVAIQTFNLLYYFPFMYTHWSHFSS
jgi:hypothetical protein